MSKSNNPPKKTVPKKDLKVDKRDSGTGKALNRKEKTSKDTNSTGPRKK